MAEKITRPAFDLTSSRSEGQAQEYNGGRLNNKAHRDASLTVRGAEYEIQTGGKPAGITDKISEITAVPVEQWFQRQQEGKNWYEMLIQVMPIDKRKEIIGHKKYDHKDQSKKVEVTDTELAQFDKNDQLQLRSIKVNSLTEAMAYKNIFKLMNRGSYRAACFLVDKLDEIFDKPKREETKLGDIRSIVQEACAESIKPGRSS